MDQDASELKTLFRRADRLFRTTTHPAVVRLPVEGRMPPLDGATAWQTFVHLTLPHMRRYLELGALLGSIYIVQNFDAVFTLTSGGLGTACYGLTKAMSSIGTDILFVLPRPVSTPFSNPAAFVLMPTQSGGLSTQ